MTTTAAKPKATDEPRDPDVGTGTLASKLARIMGRLDRIDRDGRVEGGQGYSYASADQVSDVLRPALAAEGVVLIPADVEVIDQRIDEFEKVDRSGKPYTQTRYTCALRVEWTLTDGETELRMATVGTGVDYAGKAANAAHTFARVNALKSAFHLSTGDDPESAQTPHSGGSRQRQEWTGELPTIVDPAGVSGTVAVSEDGTQVGVKFRAEDRADFDAIKDTAKAMGGRWNSDAKLWALPIDQAEAAVIFGRHLGLSLDPRLAERFPAEPSDDLAPPAAQAPQSGPADDDENIPF
jgi:hypothetical protein